MNLAQAWQEWLSSDEGRNAAEPTTIELPIRLGEYLQNRLWHAFMSGAAANSTSLQREISEWADSTFGPVGSNASVAARANKEMAELLMALISNDLHSGAAEETADVVMILMRLADRMGFDLLNEVRTKLQLNRSRKWRLTGDGHGYHVKDGAL